MGMEQVINLSSLKLATVTGIMEACVAYNLPRLTKEIKPSEFNELIDKLKEVPDKADYFPHGKWATIQRLQSILNEHIDK